MTALAQGVTGPVLQCGVGELPGEHYLSADLGHLIWGRLPCGADATVLSVAPGETVTIDTLSHEGVLEDQGRDPIAFFGRHGVRPDQVLAEAIDLAGSGRPHDPAVDGPHLVTGPIEVRGARPGDLLAITVLRLDRRVPYGVISNRHGRGALPGEMPSEPGNVSVFTPVVETADGAFGELPLTEGGPGAVRFALRPFLGVMGVAAAGDVRPHSVPPGPHGGNLDINLLVEGSTLYLPVQVPGAGAYVGDPHFAQGDGEVALTALEASLRATVRFDVVPAGEAVRLFGAELAPVAETREFLIPTGLDADLDVAAANCVRAALGLLQARYGMERHLAYAYLSAATDFNISQVVDLVKGVHARIRKADFGE
ncbi:MAG: acetamidase/formamidase family protein [Micropruina sp.]|uniref:acetamidase/formamidase family protein n=1 Tax=Micropruina sp. TaxID=2737536 RepID=UPI0039E21A90